MKITNLEKAVLVAIANSEYGDGPGSTIWTFSVWDNVDKTACPDRKSLSGAISSLVQKKLVHVAGTGKEATIRMTEAGCEAYRSF